MSRLPFLDRHPEQTRLRRCFSSRDATFVCLHGRRRLGKSRLLTETLPPGRSVYFLADEREPALQREALAHSMATRVPALERVDYPNWASLLERFWAEAPPGTILVLDELPYLVRASPELPSILQRLIDASGNRPRHLVVCGSSQRMMQGLVLDATAPLYGRAREIIELGPLAPRFVRQGLKLRAARAAVEAYAVWGGVPRYWELASRWRATWDAVVELVIDPIGVLHHEPRRLLLDDIRDAAQASSILALVGAGCHRLSEIAARLDKPATSLGRPLQRLLSLGLLRRDLAFGNAERSSRRSLYRIADPFLAFWYRFVEPRRSELAAGGVRRAGIDIARSFPVHLGTVWEDLARRAVAHLRIGGASFQPARPWWGAGLDRRPLDVEVVSESRDGKVLLVGEARLHLAPGQVPASLAALRAKGTRLPFAARYGAIEALLFVLDGSGRRPDVVTGEQILRVVP